MEEELKQIIEKNKLIKLDYDFIQLKLIEEMSELTQSILKRDKENMVEESVDTFIMLKQFLNTYVNEDEFSKMYEYKIKRTMNYLGIKE